MRFFFVLNGGWQAAYFNGQQPLRPQYSRFSSYSFGLCWAMVAPNLDVSEVTFLLHLFLDTPLKFDEEIPKMMMPYLKGDIISQ